MTVIEIMFGFLAGVLSCLTPEALLLFPLALAAAGSDKRSSTLAIALGLGLSGVLTGTLASSLAALFGFDATLVRRILCGLLLALSVILTSGRLTERFPVISGGRGTMFTETEDNPLAGMFRMLMLAILVGANWIPRVGPVLGKASLMAADTHSSGPAFEILLVFGFGAALPWILLARVVRVLIRPVASQTLSGMAGKRLLGLALLIVAILGFSGLDVILDRWVDSIAPDWMHKLATQF